MQDKICLITGGNAGIGKETAIGLAKKGANVVIITRNDEKGNQAVKDIRSKSGSDRVEYLTADLSLQKSIRSLVAEFKAKYDNLHVLINNAGVFYSDLRFSADGIELQFAINHLAPFLLTNELLDMLKDSAPARIINVSSRANYRGKINFDDLNYSKHYTGLKAYSQSKLANVLFTYELDRLLMGTGVTANCLHPGVVSTNIAMKNSKLYVRLFWGIYKLFMISPGEGATTSVYLASDEDVEGVSGKYFEKCKPKKSANLSYDEDLAKKLWQVSEELTGIKLRV